MPQDCTWEDKQVHLLFQDNKKQKLDAVRDIVALLKLSASYAIGEALTVAVLEQSAEKGLSYAPTTFKKPSGCAFETVLLQKSRRIAGHWRW